MDQVIRHEMLGLVDLFLGGRPAQDRLDLLDDFLRNAGGLGDVRLLGQILAEQALGVVDGLVVIFVHRADDQLRAVEVFQLAAGFLKRPCPAAPSALSLYSGGTQ